MSNHLIEKVAGFGFIKLQGGYNSALPINTTGAITGGSVGATGGFAVLSGQATPAGTATLTPALALGAAGINFYYGSGAPTFSAVHANDVYFRTDGSSGTTRIYVATNTSGTWTNVTTAA